RILCYFFISASPAAHHRLLHSFPTRRSSDLPMNTISKRCPIACHTAINRWSFHKRNDLHICRIRQHRCLYVTRSHAAADMHSTRSEEHTSELQSRFDLVCRLLLEKKKNHRTQ